MISICPTRFEATFTAAVRVVCIQYGKKQKRQCPNVEGLINSSEQYPLGSRNDPMVRITMLLIHLRCFIGQYPLPSRPYDILKNSIITHESESLRDGNSAEFICTIEDAKALLAYASQHYAIAAPYINDGIATTTAATESRSPLAH